MAQIAAYTTVTQIQLNLVAIVPQHLGRHRIASGVSSCSIGATRMLVILALDEITVLLLERQIHPLQAKREPTRGNLSSSAEGLAPRPS